MVASLYMAEAGLLAGLELVVRLVLVLVHVLQEVQSQGRREWMRKIGVDHNTGSSRQMLNSTVHMASYAQLLFSHCVPMGTRSFGGK